MDNAYEVSLHVLLEYVEPEKNTTSFCANMGKYHDDF